MNVSPGARWEGFVEAIVKDGRYRSASLVVHEGLRLVEDREASLATPREVLSASIAEDSEHSDADLARTLEPAMAIKNQETEWTGSSV